MDDDYEDFVAGTDGIYEDAEEEETEESSADADYFNPDDYDEED